MRGFVAFQGRSKGGVTAWMERSNSVSGLYEKLGSREWKWIDTEWRVIDTDKYEDGWTYSENIDGFYSTGKPKKATARRRIWQRRARFECRGPWLAVEAPPLRYIEVQKIVCDRILVWAVTMNGEVLIRQGVTAAHPQGTTWKHVICDYKVEEISISSPTCVWATTAEGRLLRRECSDQTDIECVAWSEVVYSPLSRVYSFSASRNIVVLLPANDPQLKVIDIKRGKLSQCFTLPKATYVTIDGEDQAYCCDGTRIVKLENSIANTEQNGVLKFQISESDFLLVHEKNQSVVFASAVFAPADIAPTRYETRAPPAMLKSNHHHERQS
ncbi:hypothetical protein KIN20_024767 [Parelaphostrongylus tenuis]|uniref:Peroxin/Ferlin domain-containing protein n=1 Tax=Parelaphostrongylus tenuis TaxID=148309 RepID=A0AAD5MU03_PARTN|nr:hypothetical protein KIN20_024767 [Parelaphostrongylus tenuis]